MRIGLIGLGKQGRHLYHVFNKLRPGCITHCFDPFVKNDLGLIQSECIIDDVDAMIIASPHSQHAAQTLAAIEFNKHVFVEKPIALNHKDLDAINKVWATKHVVIRQNLKYRYMFHKTPCLGTVRYVSLTYTRKRGVPLTPFFTQEVYAQGGVVADLGPHLVDMALYLSGWPGVHPPSWNDMHQSHAKLTQHMPSPIGTDSGWTDWSEDLDREIHGTMDVPDRWFANVGVSHNRHLSYPDCLMSFDIGWVAHQKQDEVFYLKIVGEEGTLYAHKMEVVKADGTTEIIGTCDESKLDELSVQDFLNEIDGKPVKINQSMEQWIKTLHIMGF